jgi:hypothetical protein
VNQKNDAAPCGSDPAPALHLLDRDPYPAPGRPNDGAPGPPTSFLAVFTQKIKKTHFDAAPVVARDKMRPLVPPAPALASHY